MKMSKYYKILFETNAFNEFERFLKEYKIKKTDTIHVFSYINFSIDKANKNKRLSPRFKMIIRLYLLLEEILGKEKFGEVLNFISKNKKGKNGK